MASEHLTASDVCEHGEVPANCKRCNPIFEDEARTMPAFHSVTVRGTADGQVITTIEMQPVGAR